MSYWYLLKTALIGLRTNKVRSFLTVLGIVIGITAIILIMSIGEGAQRLILGQIQGMGADMVVVRPGKKPSGPSDFGASLFSDSLKSRDIEALLRKENVPEVLETAPVVIVPSSVSAGGEVSRPTVFGWSAEFMERVMDIHAKSGTLFDESDIRTQSTVAVIGATVAKDLFPNEDALGKNIRIKGKNFTVVAVLSSKGKTSFFNADELVVVPYTTAQKYLMGINYYTEVMVRVSNADAVARSVRDIEATLREQHRIDDPKKDDFYVETQQGLISQISTILSVLTAFLSSVVAISLIVGGIGVMNVMLVSVTERTKEIGLRKAVGATPSDIMAQFLIEAVVLTLVGGIVGIALGSLFAFGTAIVLTQTLAVDWTYTFPMSAAILGMSVSAGVGLVFGIYPARKASKKSPIEALRYE